MITSTNTSMNMAMAKRSTATPSRRRHDWINAGAPVGCDRQNLPVNDATHGVNTLMEKCRQMNKLFTLAVTALVVLAFADVALAQDAQQQALDLARTSNIGRGIGQGLAAGLGVIGAGLGIGWIG